jgi:hypothetical protein
MEQEDKKAEEENRQQQEEEEEDEQQQQQQLEQAGGASLAQTTDGRTALKEGVYVCVEVPEISLGLEGLTTE